MTVMKRCQLKISEGSALMPRAYLAREESEKPAIANRKWPSSTQGQSIVPLYLKKTQEPGLDRETSCGSPGL